MPEETKSLLSPEQYRIAVEVGGVIGERLAEKAGLGAPRERTQQLLGIGQVNDPTKVEQSVLALLAAGSPRLALARALGFGFKPYLINVRATFASTDTTDIPSIGSDVKIVQDTLLDSMVVSIVNQSNTANLSIFQAQSDAFFKQQSGIEATLDVQGSPRYSIAPKFTPLATMADFFNGNAFWPRDWILTYQQQLFMAFHATVTLPFAPIEVIVTFRTYTNIGDSFVDMSNRTAIALLERDCGIVVTEAYKNVVTQGLWNNRI